jgi:cysteine desulfurase
MVPEAVDAMTDALVVCGNPSSIHQEGQKARAMLEHARGQVARLVGSAPAEIVFTSGATESNNAAIATLASRDGAILSSVVEHPSVIGPLDELRRHGQHLVLVGVDGEGRLPPADEVIEAGERGGVRSLSLMLANNEIGNLTPVAEIAALAHQRGWWVHCDAVQAVGRIPVDVDALGVDLLSLSGHKFGGPRGVGALYVRRGIELVPILSGGHQERGRRSGTENVAAIVGLGAAAEAARHWVSAGDGVAALRDRLWEGIAARDPSAVRQGSTDDPLPNTLNVRFERVSGETLAMNFDLEGVAVSAGSACSSGSLDPSHVLLAMGVPYEAARGSIRFSLGRATTAEDVDDVLERLPAILARTRQERR